MHSFGAVWSQDAAVLPHTSRDGQTGLVPHGFGKRQLFEIDQRGQTVSKSKEKGKKKYDHLPRI